MVLRQWINSARSFIQSDIQYQSLPTKSTANGHAANGNTAWKSGPESARSKIAAILHHKRARVALVSGFVALILLAILGSASEAPKRLVTNVLPASALRSSSTPSTGTSTEPRYLRLLIPASSADAGLCKTVISSSILGFPAPVLINWDKQYNNEHLIFGGSHLAKIRGVLSHLNTLPPENDEDLVMVADGYDVWFQLRPSVLLNRYFEINAQANARIHKQLGSTARRMGVEQKVLFSSQKRCWPKEATHPACWAVPESSLPEDVYGNQTDTDIGDQKNPFVKYRQRYLNSGSVIGPVSAVRAIFERAASKADLDQNIGSDQGVFAEIFGEQEFQRHVLAFQSRSIPTKLADYFRKKFDYDYSYKLIDPALRGNKEFMELEPEEPLNWEFGIGLDYRSEILQATVFSEFDTEWLSRSDRLKIQSTSTDLGIPNPPRVGHLPADIAASVPPYRDTRHGMYPGGQLPLKETWNTIPLFTNVWSGISPVAVHHNAHRDGLKNRIMTHWDRTWFFPHLRALLDQRALAPQLPLATTVWSSDESLNRGGDKTEWWPPTYRSWDNESGGVLTDTGEWGDFDKLCSAEGVWREVMRDGKGPWWDPRFREFPPIVVGEEGEGERKLGKGLGAAVEVMKGKGEGEGEESEGFQGEDEGAFAEEGQFEEAAEDGEEKQETDEDTSNGSDSSPSPDIVDTDLATGNTDGVSS